MASLGQRLINGRWLFASLVVALLLLLLLTPRAAPDAPALTFTTISGESVSLQQLRGRVVLVNFWATTCNYCRDEMPGLVRAWRRYHPSGLELIAVAMPYDRPDWVLAYAQGAGLPFHVALDYLGDATRAFGGIPGTPTAFIIGRDGKLRERIVGETDEHRLRERLESALAGT